MAVDSLMALTACMYKWYFSKYLHYFQQTNIRSVTLRERLDNSALRASGFTFNARYLVSQSLSDLFGLLDLKITTICIYLLVE